MRPSVQCASAVYIRILLKMKRFTNEELKALLDSTGVRPSGPRFAVLRYIASHHTHPTAEEIHRALLPELPTLSLTTVYNSLKILADSGLVKELAVNASGMHYDLQLQPRHAHFVCCACGRIFDMPLPEHLGVNPGDGFEVDAVEVYAKGLCPGCSSAATARGLEALRRNAAYKQ